MRSDKIEHILSLPCHLFVRAIRKDRKFLFREMHERFKSTDFVFFSERNDRGHFVYKVDNITKTVEVVPINVMKFPTSKFHQEIRIIKLSSFIQNRIKLGMTFTTEKIFEHYKNSR